MFSALKIVALAVLCGLAAAGGGNCANVCESGMTHYRTCIAQTMCTDVATSTACTDDDDATLCTCAGSGDEGCQACFDDIYDACGGCGQNDFDTLLAPAIKTTAEGMGCAGAAAAAPAMFVALAAAVGHILG